ncbi:MAG: alpha/beta hydrolase [Candidatus Eremiobacteraeota bacterium]|nr:alpha/beta hydrolase [Candidatus Eremiobacteraeota bacterium]
MRLLALMLGFAVLATAALGRPPSPASGVLSLTRCAHAYAVRAVCGNYLVFENRATRQGRQIPIVFVLFPAASKTADDAILDLSGGPGEAGTDDALDISGLRAVLATHALLFADIRGTGRSGGLFCNPTLADPRVPQTLFDEDLFPLRNVLQCRRNLEKRADLRQYTSDNAMDDLDDLRQALGFRTVTLSGGSYGTQAAQVYIRRHPAAVRAALLTSVASMDFKLPLPFAKVAQSALDGVFADCRADPPCRRAFPDPGRDLATILSRLRSSALHVSIHLQQPRRDALITLGPGMFAERLREMLYDPKLSHRVPLVLHRAALGDYQPLAQNLYEIGASFQDPSFAYGLYLSMTCAEDVAFIREADIRRDTDGTFAGNSRVRAQQRVCARWHSAAVDGAFLHAVHATIPVLLISGTNDPATPPWAAQAVLRGFPNGRLITIPGGTHFTGGPCYDAMDRALLLTAAPWSVHTSCVGTVNRLPFPITLAH